MRGNKTHLGRQALVSYHKKRDEARKIFLTQPVHDWSSTASDAFRYLAVGHKSAQIKERQIYERRLEWREGEEALDWLGT